MSEKQKVSVFWKAKTAVKLASITAILSFFMTFNTVKKRGRVLSLLLNLSDVKTMLSHINMTVLFKNSQTLTVARFSGRKEGQDLGLAVQTAMFTVLIRTDTGTFMGCLTSV